MAIITINIPDCPGCCTPKECHDLWGDTLDVVISGISACGCFSTSPTDHYSAAISGVSGSYTAVWNTTTLLWEVVVGSVTYTTYSDDTCTTPSGTIGPLDVKLFILCTANCILVRIKETPDTLGPNIYIFREPELTCWELDDAIPNQNTCPGFPAGGGTVTVSLP